MIRESVILRGVVIVVVAMFVGVASLSAQLLPERGLVREGNKQFRRHNYYNSLNRYNEALEHAPNSYEALYNRANAFMHITLENPDSTYTAELSNAIYEGVIGLESISDVQRAELLRNIGESLFLQQNYEAALNAFRESLKLNPDDAETKRNYILTKRIVDQKRNAQQNSQNNQNQDKNQDKNQDQNSDGGGGDDNQDQQQNDNNDNKGENNQDRDKGDDKRDNNQDPESDDNNSDEEPDDEEQNPDGDDPKQEDAPQDNNPKPQNLSGEQERMLDAIQAEEDKTQDKIKNGKQGVVIHGKKNW
ncbi:MAG: tetratricopeptide repeat protein [Alistipes sp.]|nr:tetratricopeptide repeat protein [Alistipes sp.]